MVQICLANRAVHCFPQSDISWIHKVRVLRLRMYPYPILASGSANPNELQTLDVQRSLDDRKGSSDRASQNRVRIGYPLLGHHHEILAPRDGWCHELSECFLSQPQLFSTSRKDAVCMGNGASRSTPPPKELRNSWHRCVLCPEETPIPTMLCGSLERGFIVARKKGIARGNIARARLAFWRVASLELGISFGRRI